MKPRVLIVDDAPVSRLWMEMLLGSRYEVHSAGDGAAGVARALAIEPHLILLDVVMPLLDGLEACRALRARPEAAATPIILVTAQDDELDVEAGYLAGCTDYITKPLDRAEFTAKVESWLAVAVDA